MLKPVAIGRQHEVDFILRRQALHRLYVFARIGLVVIIDHLDHPFFAADTQPAAIIDLLDPHFDIRCVRDRLAAGERSGLVGNDSKFDGIGGHRRGGHPAGHACCDDALCRHLSIRYDGPLFPPGNVLIFRGVKTIR